MSEKTRPHVRLAPLLLPFGLLFCGGLALTFAQSLGLLTPLASKTPIGAAYAVLLDPLFLRAFLFTAYVALVSAGLATTLGALAAYALWRLPEAWRLAGSVYRIPLVLPHIAAAFIILVLLSQSGFLASLAHALGLIDAPGEFPALLFAGDGLGVIAAYAYKGMAFVILLAYASLARFDRRLIETARMLGAGQTRIFLRVILPRLRPPLAACFLILFLYAFGGFDIPYLLAESDPGMLSILAFNAYFKRDLADRPQAMAMLTAMFLFAALVAWLYVAIAKRIADRERKL